MLQEMPMFSSSDIKDDDGSRNEKEANGNA